MKYNYEVWEVYYPNDWTELAYFETLEEALEHKLKLQEKAKEANNTMYDYVVVISDY